MKKPISASAEMSSGVSPIEGSPILVPDCALQPGEGPSSATRKVTGTAGWVISLHRAGGKARPFSQRAGTALPSASSCPPPGASPPGPGLGRRSGVLYRQPAPRDGSGDTGHDVSRALLSGSAVVTHRSNGGSVNFSVGLFVASFARSLLYHNWPSASAALPCSGTQPDGSRDTLGRQRAALPQPRCVPGRGSAPSPPLLRHFCPRSRGDRDRGSVS